MRISNSTPTNADNSKSVEAVCPVGKVVVGGGFDINADRKILANLVPEDSFANTDTSWQVKVSYKTCDCDPYPWSVTVWAICVDKSPTP